MDGLISVPIRAIRGQRPDNGFGFFWTAILPEPPLGSLQFCRQKLVVGREQAAEAQQNHAGRAEGRGLSLIHI